MMRGSIGRGVLGSVVLLVVAAAAALGQQGPLVCSIVSGVECDDQLNCQPPLRDPPPPTFLRVDVDGGLITLLAPESRRGEETRIDAVARQGGQTILSGAEAGRGWSMVISDDDLHMSLTMTEDRTGFVVFGECIAADAISP